MGTELERLVGAVGSLREACCRRGSDVKLLLLHALFLVYVTLTSELASRCQIKSSPINLCASWDLSSARLKFN